MKYVFKKGIESPIFNVRDNIVTKVNDQFVNLTGYQKDELVGKTINEVGKMLRIDLQMTLEMSGSRDSCYLFTKDLEPREVNVSCKSPQDKNEKVYLIKEKYKSRLDDIVPFFYNFFLYDEKGLVIYSAPDLRILKMNKTFLVQNNISEGNIGEYIGHNLTDKISDLIGIDYEKDYIDAIKHGKIIHVKEFRLKKIAYREMYVETTLIPVSIKGELKYLVELVEDVTERVISRKIIVENIDLCFVRYTYPEFNIISVNNQCYNTFKQINSHIESQSAIINQNLHDIFDDNLVIDEKVQKHLKINKTSSFKIEKYLINGEDLYIKWIHQPLLDLNNEIIEVMAIGIDMTKEEKDKKKMEEVLKIQDEIYANVSHELKTPLNVIFSANQMINIYLQNDCIEQYRQKITDYSHSINKNCYRQLKLINNIIDLSKSNSGLLQIELSDIDIVDVIRNIVHSVSGYVESRELHIFFNSNTDKKIIACDVDKIDRVMLNLISNAVKFSNPNGSINVNFSDKGDVVEISVVDTGKGIKKKHQEHIFQRFYRADKSLSRNAEGSGMGLSLVKSIIELHKGTISVKSVVGKGSTFKIELPAITVQKPYSREPKSSMSNKVEMINIEFSDIYSN